MNIKPEFLQIIKDIKEQNIDIQLTTRDFLRYFSCEKRTKGNKGRIDVYLEEQNLETSPNYAELWIDGTLILKHKARAKSKASTSPIQKISILPAANKPPISISRDAKLSDAITQMMMHNFSQLPVMSNPRSVAGFITWESIGYGITNGNSSNEVKDFLDTNVTIVDLDKPLLDAIKIVIEKDFVLVQKKDKSLSGIVTIADISTQFLLLTEPFLLLEQIENLIRLLLDEKFLVQDIKSFCEEEEFENTIEFIDDLTFGQYIRLIEKPDNWIKLNLKIDRIPFINQLDSIREIRNDIMHFDPEGITPEQKQSLVNMAKFLTELIKYK
ncbi:XRE family transcriptional regulator [Pedobacter yonginense]|uniref:XRE family transcriptional regulator n=1 Tax=Pedobacter yonginense TaxID=651869 RepID=A0A317EI29_9SPHI|nr:CBS domain-containing protein [Pedobacter yonginense]PWS26460.1 XRE family transcriptional regulator [Pedobacter yonginense]